MKLVKKAIADVPLIAISSILVALLAAFLLLEFFVVGDVPRLGDRASSQTADGALALKASLPHGHPDLELVEWGGPRKDGPLYLATLQAIRVLEQHYVAPSRISGCELLSRTYNRVRKEKGSLGLVAYSLAVRHGSSKVPSSAPVALNLEPAEGLGAGPGCYPPGPVAFVSSSKMLGLRLEPEEAGIDFGQGSPQGAAPEDAVSRQVAPLVASLLQWVADLNPDQGLRLFWLVFNDVLKSLDPHSSFLSGEEYEDLRSGTRGQFGGVGVVINEFHGMPFIREIVPNSPAQMAGIEPNDVLLKVGDETVSLSGIEDALAKIRGRTRDGLLAMWLYRPRSRRVYKTFVAREDVPSSSVEERIIEGAPDVLHMRVSGFSSKTSNEIHEIYMRALKREKGAIKSMILDLRGNPGGLLDQAVQVSDLFLSEGKIVVTRSRYENQVEHASANQLINLPLVVLVNSSSASASEIVAGALKDSARALVIGEQTFGKGSVQSLFEISRLGALKLTIAHYFTPAGASIQNTGVVPHIIVRLAQLKEEQLWVAGGSERRREAELLHRLDAPNGSLDPGAKPEGTGVLRDSPSLWALTEDDLSSLGPLGQLSLSYPNYENTDKVTFLASDAYVRVAVSLLRSAEKSPSGVWSLTQDFLHFLPEVRQREGLAIERGMASRFSEPARVSKDILAQLVADQKGTFAPDDQKDLGKSASPMQWVPHAVVPVRDDWEMGPKPDFMIRLIPTAVLRMAGSRPKGELLVGLVPEAGASPQPGIWKTVSLDSAMETGSGEYDLAMKLPRLFWTAWSALTLGRSQSFEVRAKFGVEGSELLVGLWTPSFSNDERSLQNSSGPARVDLKLIENPPAGGKRIFTVRASFVDVEGLEGPCEIIVAPMVDRSVEIEAAVETAQDRTPAIACPTWVGRVHVSQGSNTSTASGSGFGGIVAMLLRDAKGLIRARARVLEIEGGRVNAALVNDSPGP